MTVIDFNERRSSTNIDVPDSHYSIKALDALLSRVVKILMHRDGVHSVCRQYCESKEVVERAKNRRYMMLDLGHVIRLYFGDDYFDLHLDHQIPYQRNEEFTKLVSDLTEEVHLNESKVSPDPFA